MLAKLNRETVLGWIGRNVSRNAPISLGIVLNLFKSKRTDFLHIPIPEIVLRTDIQNMVAIIQVGSFQRESHCIAIYLYHISISLAWVMVKKIFCPFCRFWRFEINKRR